jgi:protein-S-isoprenylcysteine O-methyltransferase Ste14
MPAATFRGERDELAGAPSTFASDAPPKRVRSGVPTTAMAVAGNVLLAAFYLLFVLRHVAFARHTGAWATTMPLVVQESILVPLILTRRRSTATSRSPLDWVAGVACTFLPLLMRAAETTTAFRPVGETLQILGLSVVILSIAFLRRSFGLVAAHRGIKTGGPYALVRHPMYAAYMVSQIGYVLVNQSPRNVAIAVITCGGLALRAALEERLLARDPAYESYRRRIRWRFVPYVY